MNSSGASSDTNRQNFLWKLFRLVFVEGHQGDAIDEISGFFPSSDSAHDSVDKSLAAFRSSRNLSNLIDLAVSCVENVSFAPCPQAYLVAYLYKQGQLSLKRAFACLNFRGINTNILPPSIQRLADVVWLLQEDEERGFPLANNDQLLSDALLSVSTEGLPPMPTQTRYCSAKADNGC